MAYPNLYDRKECDQVIERINCLTPDTNPQWGKMSVDQMLAHCNVAYDMSFTDKIKQPGTFGKFIIKLLVKKAVVGPKPYPKNGRTAPDFIITGNRDFGAEKSKIIDYLNKVQSMGAAEFEQKESHSMGKLTSQEWNILFSKHLDHHLTQFGV